MRRYFLLGLFLLLGSMTLAACGSESSVNSVNSGAPGGNAVHITLSEMKVESDVSTFTKGTPYHFIVENKGNIPYEFTITKTRQGNENEKALDARSLKDLDNIDAGQKQEFDFTFPAAAPAGTLEFECAYPGHYEQGMHMGIVVQ